ncbi:unnamed protein product [Strongylus vulgaris]|uniref:Nuclear receptor domain-containing protein n=1 Tax=Strongylus vulgaris TaxID=40348 RepID=A0A3P7IZZ8_STRVU|nr:unnamed protein product [Strongylus vulgaris]
MKPRKCEICESPTARSIHFGARACKACAAFFRRTVALNVVYECKEPTPCVIHYGKQQTLENRTLNQINFTLTLLINILYLPFLIITEKRMCCKKCRYDKCIAAKMCRELVRSTRGSDRNSSHTPKDCEASVQSTSFDYNGYTEPTMFPSPPTHLPDLPRITLGQKIVISHVPFADGGKESRRRVIDHYKRIEAELNNRRRIMYTDTKMINVFATMCECPYEKKHLKPLNYKEYVGNSRSDFIMLYDYTIAFMEFDELQPFEKQAVYRYVCGVDNLLNSAYFTCCLAYEEKLMVLNSCEYLCVDPMPMTGDEPWAQHLFTNSEDLDRYKSIIPRKAALWQSLVVPFHDLNLQFDEFCLLKALVTINSAKVGGEYAADSATSSSDVSMISPWNDRVIQKNGWET